MKLILASSILVALFSFGKKETHWLIKNCENIYWEGTLNEQRVVLQFIDEEPGDIRFTGYFRIFGNSIEEHKFKGFTYSVVTPLFYGGQPNTKLCKILSSPNCDSLVINNSREDAFEFLPESIIFYKKLK